VHPAPGDTPLKQQLYYSYTGAIDDCAFRRKQRLKILVCIKQVADSESPFGISGDGKSLVFGARASWRINSYDEYALEEALIVAEAHPGSRVEVLSIGPDRVKEALRRALSLGASEAHHLRVDGAGPLSAEARARIIAGFAVDRAFDLVFTGVMSEDRGGTAVGPMTAALLGIPWATHAISLSVDEAGTSVRVEREIDGTRRHPVTLPMPALVTIQSGINRPRYPSLSNVLRAKSQEIPGLPAGATDQTHGIVSGKISLPPETRRGIILRDDTRVMAGKLLEYLHSISIL